MANLNEYQKEALRFGIIGKFRPSYTISGYSKPLSESEFLWKIAQKKVELVEEWAIQKFVISKSRTTCSFYIRVWETKTKFFKIRISDHPSKKFTGKYQIIVSWNDDIMDVIFTIIKLTKP